MVTVQLQAVPQWREALERANEVRIYHRAVKARLKARDVRLSDVLADEACASMRVADVLRSLPAIGPVKSSHYMRMVGVGPTWTVGMLTPRQRGALVHVLRERA